ncbi:MAG: RdgB/HAM1 family non-canonical purine NTP pyrophosphatase [Ignavibacteriae bacterium]|nr:RdgB/HAM1 family non-canonical purine NTP pyrophosphatase [Ignavibacteriota bacterium]
MKIIFATGNKGKLIEVRNIFSDTKFEIISMEEIGFAEEIIEDGKTFEENSFIKADKIFSGFKIPVIADDSGLAVDQLNGEPGIFSARYAGEDVSYYDNNIKLLNELKNFPEPHLAKFLCSAVYVDEKNRISVLGDLPGKIINEFKGEHGFGYDPIFQPDGFDLTLAQMNLEDKNRISHRAKAFNLLKKKIEEVKT